MKTAPTRRDSSKVRSVQAISASRRVSALSAVGLLIGVGMLAGCSDPAPSGGISEPDPELVFLRGYRSADDDCKLTGESAFTVEFLDDAADLVTCSTGSSDAASLVSETSARLVTQTNSFSLFSVPRR
jgi:hypothetical protein